MSWFEQMLMIAICYKTITSCHWTYCKQVFYKKIRHCFEKQEIGEKYDLVQTICTTVWLTFKIDNNILQEIDRLKTKSPVSKYWSFKNNYQKIRL